MFWSIMWAAWDFRNGLVVPQADPVPPMKTIFKAMALFEGFRHFLIASGTSPQDYYLWTEAEMSREWDWSALEVPVDNFDDKIEVFLEYCSAHYPMVKRFSFVKEFHSLLRQFADNFTQVMTDHNS